MTQFEAINWEQILGYAQKQYSLENCLGLETTVIITKTIGDFLLQEVEYSSRNLSTMLAMLVYIIGRDEEDSLLARLEDLKLCVREQNDDPLNATAANLNDPPQTVFARSVIAVFISLTNVLIIYGVLVGN